MLGTRRPALVFLSLFAASGCADDVSSAEGSGSSTSSSTGLDSTTVDGSTSAPSGSSTADGSSSDSSTQGSTGSSGDDSSGTTGGSSEGTTQGGTTSSTGDTDGGETGGVATVCENGGEFVLSWGLQVPGGVYPDDIPEDLTATCSFAPSMTAGEIPFTCGDVDFLVTVESTPMVALPDAAQSVEVRIHRQVGPLGFPDFWVQLDFADGQQLALINSSVLEPNNATVELPYNMALSDQDCGPYNIGTLFKPEDPCGDQLWLGLELELDVPLTIFHGTQAEGASEGTDVGVWVQSARDYGVLPKFCDFSATFYSVMVATAGQ